jgi:ABC-type sugar transport system ATPase subunit
VSAAALPAQPPVPAVRLAGIEKAFPGVRAIRSASLELRPGEIHALVGENGAGKSTLIKVITGAHRPDRGTLELFGKRARLASPAAGLRAGVAAIYQELALVPAMSVRDNLFLGREPARAGVVDRATETQRAREALSRLGMAIDLDAEVRSLGVAQQQFVEIVKALERAARVLILDEPTAALSGHETERLFAVLAELRRRGIAILYISHRLEEVLRIADRTTIMRDGETLGTWPAGALTREEIVERMVGRPLTDEYPVKRGAALGDELLAVENLCGGAVKGVSFAVRRGEVLGIAGLVGSGRTELARLIFGADRRSGGTIRLAGQELVIESPRDAIRAGICLLTEDRKAQGLLLGRSAKENFALPNLGRWSRWGWLRLALERTAFARHVAALGLKVSGERQTAGQLSGGNQQKLLIARWLETDSLVVIFDEPTRGVDVGARYEIYLLIHELARRGKAIIIISSELPEVLGVCGRILVMRDGLLTGEITDVAGATQEQLLELAVA